MPSILVTGGAGFIGSHLVSLLLDQNNEVLVMDMLWTGSRDSISKFQDNAKFTFIKHDVTNPFPRDMEVDQIYHLACPASPRRFPENPIGILETCFKGTQNVLELARRCNARVLLASTSEVYGDALVCPQPESYHGNVNPWGPRSCYDEGKRVAEALAYGYRHQHGLEIRIARIFNAYGPGMLPDDGRVVPNFITAALAGEPMVINGDGHSIRCFQYVTDCVDGLVKLMDSSCEEPVNIGNDKQTEIRVLAMEVGNMVAQKKGEKDRVPVEMKPKLQDDPVRRQPDISLAKEKLGWGPTVSLTDGLEKTVDWFVARQK